MGNVLTRLLRLFGYGILSVTVVIAIITVRLMNDAKQSLKEATYAMETGKRELAAAHLEDAAKSFVPGSDYTKSALRELTILAQAAEMRGETKRALSLWESVRRSVIASRSFFQPNEQILITAEKNIERLRGVSKKSAQSLGLTARPIDPSPLLSIFIWVGLVVWIVSTATYLAAPQKRDGGPLIRNIYLFAAGFSGLTIWLVGSFLV